MQRRYLNTCLISSSPITAHRVARRPIRTLLFSHVTSIACNSNGKELKNRIVSMALLGPVNEHTGEHEPIISGLSTINCRQRGLLSGRDHGLQFSRSCSICARKWAAVSSDFLQLYFTVGWQKIIFSAFTGCTIVFQWQGWWRMTNKIVHWWCFSFSNSIQFLKFCYTY